MNIGRRSLLSFLDLALVMTGVMGMLVHAGDNRQAAAAAIADRFSDSADRRSEARFPVESFFEPHDARLTSAGKAKLAPYTRIEATTGIVIAVPMLEGSGNDRLDHWELSAARTASIMHFLAENGVEAEQMTPRMERLRTSRDGPRTAPALRIETVKRAVTR